MDSPEEHDHASHNVKTQRRNTSKKANAWIDCWYDNVRLLSLLPLGILAFTAQASPATWLMDFMFWLIFLAPAAILLTLLMAFAKVVHNWFLETPADGQAGMTCDALMTKQIKNSRQKMDEVQLLLNGIKELNDARNRSEDLVQNKADRLRQFLDIHPNCWLNNFNQKTVSEMISGMSKDLMTLSNFLSAERDFNSGQTLDNASDGLALCGIIPTYNESDFQQCRTKLLSASTCQPRIRIPEKCQDEIFEVVHCSKKDFEEWNKMLHLLGFNIATKLKLKNSGKDAAADQDSCGTFGDVHYSKTMCILVSTGHMDIKGTGSFQLSAEALEDLQRIDRSAAEGADEQLERKSIEFLTRYGSHVGLDVVMGGIFRVSVVYSGPERLICDQSTKVIVDDIYNAVVSASYTACLAPVSIGGSLNEEKMKDIDRSGTYDPSVLSKIYVQVERMGGSRDVESIPLWKASLGLGSDVCSVVVNNPSKLCAIWDLLPEINPNELHHPEQVAYHLIHASQTTSVPTDHSNSSASTGFPIAHALASDENKLRDRSKSYPIGTYISVEASVSSPVEGPPTEEPSGSVQKDPMAGQTPNLSGTHPSGEASLSSPAEGPPTEKPSGSVQKEPAASQTSNLPDTNMSGEASVSPPVEPDERELVDGQLSSTPGTGTPAEARPSVNSSQNRYSCQELLSLLDLKLLYPQKLTLNDVLSIKDRREEDESLTVPEIPWVILKKLLMMNYEGRNTAWQDMLEKPNTATDQSKELLDGLSSLLADHDYDLQGNDIPHPTDIFLALYSCCDLMLRQVLTEKMTMCRLSVPFVTPHLPESNPATLCKWALRSVVSEYCTGDEEVEVALVDCPMKVVSFVRIGEIPISKSHLLNGVLGAQSHHTFFNKESCHLSTSDRTISNGMIEAAWYMPNKRDKGLFDDVIMFLNIRGNAASFPDQTRLLSTISSIVTVFVDINDLDSDATVAAIRALYQQELKFVLILTGTATNAGLRVEKYREKVGEEIMSATTKALINTSPRKGKQKTLVQIEHAIREKLSEMLKEERAKTYEDLSLLVENEGVSIDENDHECKEGKKYADRTTLHIRTTDTDMAQTKNDQLPIQKLWLEWSKLQKSLNRTKGKNGETTTLKEREKLQSKMVSLRKEQYEVCKKPTPVLNNFTTTLTKFIDKPTTLCFYLQWLKFFFDNLSRKNLPKLRREYKSHRAKLNTAMGQTAEEDSKDVSDISKLQLQLKQTGKRLVEASFGLEHLFREVGQLYEASKECKDDSSPDLKKFIDLLPKVVANLIFLGHPIELMDGDAANVPLTWVEAILTSLAEHTKDKRVSVLSVLGIQSSGKSTLLNTMFGLRFAVSAGRCTRGVYAQLVAVDKSTKDLSYEYILVVDTEGLKAPELDQDKYEHDNELATLTIGLGDVVIMNIKGENTSEAMKDVLDIAIHAFLRMKCVKLHAESPQSCVFIHQNVPAANANDKMALGRQKLLENLNDMTKLAAEQEHTDVHSLNQIIRLHADRGVWYFLDLWQGNPPMAPVNPGYSEGVENVRKSLLFDINQDRKFLSVTQLLDRIKDLWEGILADDFVFSFRNTLAVKAYSEVEDTCHKATSVIERSVMEWFLDSAQTKLERCKTEDELDEVAETLMRQLQGKVKLLRDEEVKKLEKFFDDNRLNHITNQWRDEKITSMTLLADSVKTRMNNEINQKKVFLMFKVRQTAEEDECLKKILAKARKIADKNKGKYLEIGKVEEKFKKVWKNWLKSHGAPTKTKEPSIEAAVESVLHEKFFQNIKHVSAELKRCPLTDPAKPPLFGALGRKRGGESTGLKSTSTEEQLNNALERIDFFETIKCFLGKITLKDSPCTAAFIKYYAGTAVDEMLGLCRHHNLTLPPEYEVQLAVHVCRLVISNLTNMREVYNRQHSPKSQLLNLEKKAQKLFKNLFEKSAAQSFCDYLAELIEEKVKVKIICKIKDDAYDDYSGKKYNVIVAILKDLAGRDGFANDWAEYLSDPNTYAFKWITEVINRKCFSPENRDREGSYASIAGSYLSDIIKGIHESIEVASDQTSSGGLSTNVSSKTEKKNITDWIKKFCEAEKVLAVRDTQVNLICQLVTDIDHFRKEVQGRLYLMEECIFTGFRRQTANTMCWEGPTPYELVMDKLWGCKALCPFCKEPCQWTDANHCDGASSPVDHRCIQHRCLGLGKVRHGVGPKTGQLAIETCGYIINDPGKGFPCQRELETCKGDDNHACIEYKKYHPHWDIAPSPIMESKSKFWLWLMATYKTQLADLYQAMEPEVLDSWSEITVKEAKNSLHESLRRES